MLVDRRTELRPEKTSPPIYLEQAVFPGLSASDRMSSNPTVNIIGPQTAVSNGATRNILGYVYFTFVCYLSIGLPLAVLPAFVHLRMGMHAALAGLVISIQYIATFLSRPWAGRISDHYGAKISVLWGMVACTLSGLLLLVAVALHFSPALTFGALIASRLALGVGESLGSTGSTLWGITSAGQQHTAKVISFNGVATYGGLALGAPLGVILDQRWGLASLGWLTTLVCGVSFILALRKSPVPVVPGEHLPFRDVLGRIAPHGMALALGGIGYSVLATFVTLYYISRHWDPNAAALCLTAFGVAFIAARLLFIHAINRYGGFRVSIVCMSVESVGVLLLWSAASPWMASCGAALTGFGFSLVFPALGVEAVKRVPMHNRGTALGVFTGFSDVSFFLVGPIAGTVIGAWGYRSVFLFALASVLTSLGIVLVLRQMQRD